MTKTKSYSLTGIDPDLWREFKAACAYYDLDIKQTFIQKIEAVVRDYNKALLDRKVKVYQKKKGVNKQ